MKKPHRPFQISFRMSAEEKERFSSVAKHYAITVTDVIRMLVKREWDEISNSMRIAGMK